MFRKTKVCTGLMFAFGGSLALGSFPSLAQQQLERVEITGSRIKRVDAEGSLPVTVINREQLDVSGAVSVAEFMRNQSYATSGNFRPQSGSSAQSFAGINLRSLGEARTLVLIDGRRAAKGPMVGDSVDLNVIPMAMIERIEILTDGASAIYGSDAIGGVVNFITRKNFEGIELMAGFHRPETQGGDRSESSAVIGVGGDKGFVLGGVARTHRDMVFTSQRPWGQQLGVSSFANNYRVSSSDPFIAVPGACTDTNFYLTAAGTCSFNFNAVAADEAEITNTSLFMNGEHQIAADWTGFMNGTISRVESFGRYAPTPAQLTVAAGSPNNPTGNAGPITLRHRFAAAGNRDTFTDNNYYNFITGVRGKLGSVDLEAGFRNSVSQYYELGRNYIVRPLAEQYINSGEYDIFFPSQNDPDILNAIKATINRDATYKEREFFGQASFNLFSMGGGAVIASLGAEHRKEMFRDQYDSLQEAGVIEGSAGNSSGGSRDVTSIAGELLLPVTKALEVNLSGRFEKYSDYGNDFAPKASIRWKVMPSLLLRASAGTGFRAPSLPVLTQKTQFSAESVLDPATCIAFGGPPATCGTTTLVQVDSYDQANSQLDSEKSKQFTLGAVWDVTPTFSVKADYWNTKITDQIVQIGAQDIIDRDRGVDPRPIPPGLGLTRAGNGAILRVDTGWANEGTLKTDGIDLSVLFSYKLGAWGGMRHDLTYSRVLSYEEGGYDFNGSIGQPKDRAVIQNQWTMGGFDFAWNINWIGRNAGSPNNPDDDRVVGSYVTHDLQLNWTPPIKNGKLTVGVVNAGDKRPALVPFDGRNFNFYLYDSYGRTPYVRYTQRF